MTSESRTCFVYITPPGSTQPVTAGRFTFNATRDPVLGSFVYGRRYRDAGGVELDPVSLPMRSGLFETTALGGMFGVLRDASPDFWGRQVIDRAIADQGRPVGFDDFDYLLLGPDDRVGALGFGTGATPPAPLRHHTALFELPALIELADRLLSGVAPADRYAALQQAEQLLRLGTSMGGARPKATILHEGQLWLAKFPAAKDRWNNPRVEHATMVLARACGLHVAETELVTVGEHDVLLSRRFDRPGTGDQATTLRLRFMSALTALRLDDQTKQGWSYPSLADTLRQQSTRQAPDRVELYRRMLFSALVSNIDDHPRNHGFIADADGWRLAPGYDITPTPSVAATRRLAMAIGDSGHDVTVDNLLSQSGRFGVEPARASAMLVEMAEQVEASWYATFRAAGVSEVDCAVVRSAFASDTLEAGLAELRRSPPTP